MSSVHHNLEVCARPSIALTLSVDATDVNLYVLAGSPAGIVNVTLTIASGVTIYRTSAPAALYQSSAFASGSLVTIVNSGTICGDGGDGPAGNGGDAIRLSNDTSIDNSFGKIFGGGGAGQQGLDVSYRAGDVTLTAGGGGAGGGQGRASGSGATGDSATFPGNDGASGSSNGPGGGGAGGNDTQGHYGGDGGGGGGWGQQGGYAGPNSVGQLPGSLPGQPGKAVNLNGHIVTWIAGHNGAQVKGAVS